MGATSSISNRSKSRKLVMVFVGTSTCPHCIRFRPVWNQFGHEARNSLPGVEIRYVDPHDRANAPLVASLQYEGYVPYVAFVVMSQDGTASQSIGFRGERTVPELLQFAQHQARIYSTTV